MQNGKSVSLADKWERQELISLCRKARLYCPVCNEVVQPKLGNKRIWHFAHIAGSNCPHWKSESEYHLKGKLQLFELIRNHGTKIMLEPYLKEIKQRPDMLIETGKSRVAIEFQCSTIELEKVLKRTRFLERSAFNPFWVLGGNRFRKVTAHSFNLTSFDSLFLQETSSQYYLTYYCPSSKLLLKATHLTPFSSKLCFAQFECVPYQQITLSHIFNPPKDQPHKSHILEWFKKKKRWRSTNKPFAHKDPFFKWFYEQGVVIPLITSYAGIPTKSLIWIETSAIIWQGWVFYKFIDQCTTINIEVVLKEFRMNVRKGVFKVRLSAYYREPRYLAAITEYFHALMKLGVLKRVEEKLYKRIKDIRPYHTMDAALAGDEIIMNKWIK